MRTLRLKLSQALATERGATAVEYALMVTFIALMIILGALTLGNKLSSVFVDAAGQI